MLRGSLPNDNESEYNKVFRRMNLTIDCITCVLVVSVCHVCPANVDRYDDFSCHRRLACLANDYA